ncbi:MAG TPA: MBL fold metallo-hydrolase [Candidatus Acidoferrales bacterium]|nr:MBL fold metallo-hydrolase [Candidatus Acidoferrales bacterium]
MRRIALIFAGILGFCLCLAPLAGAPKSLEIYFIDVEGGQSTLIVDPQGESLLIDTGWPDFDGRDANRIEAAAKAAGIDHIDYVVITHYHLDHAGGVAQLAGQMKIGTFADHGPNMENSDSTRTAYGVYEKVAEQAKRITLKPGDQIPFKGMRVQVLTAAGEEIHDALPGAGQPNPLCASEPAVPADPSENARSVGMLITYGKFRFIDLGDLTNQKELGLACPKNLIGTVDLYLTTHHGTAHPGSGDSSNARAIVDALHPRVAVMNNGQHKGGHPVAWQIVHDSPGLEDLWQLHEALDAGKDHNAAETFIANLGEKDDGNYIKVSAELNSTFTVANSRNNFHKTYTK